MGGERLTACATRPPECNFKVHIFVFVYSEEVIILFISVCDIFKCINTFYTNCTTALCDPLSPSPARVVCFTNIVDSSVRGIYFCIISTFFTVISVSVYLFDCVYFLIEMTAKKFTLEQIIFMYDTLIRMCLNGTKSRVRVSRQFSDTFEIHNGLKEMHCLLYCSISY